MAIAADYQLSDREFERLRALVRRHTAIELSDAKRQLVYSRFSRRLRALGLSSFDAYCDLVDGSDEGELHAFTSAITTNFTRFFREAHHFEALPALVAARDRTRPLRIWSAGCSTGEEPWSIAMALLETEPELDERDLTIVATDIDGAALASAERGVYAAERIEALTPARRRRFFQRGRGANAGRVRIADAPRRLVTFRTLNLVEHWDFDAPFDVIFCRNVVIYFSAATRTELVARFAAQQVAGGHLVVGHAEHLLGTSAHYAPAGITIYRRLEAPRGAAA